MDKQRTTDYFKYRDYVLFLKNKLDNSEQSHVVGVHGDYGAGKSTTMNLLKELYQETNIDFDNILEFSAWRNYYNKEETVWKALLYELAGKIFDIFDSIELDGYINLMRPEINKSNNKKSFFEKILSWSSNNESEYKEFIEAIKYTCLEIQFNLYQDLKSFDDKLEYYKNKANSDPIGALKRCLSSIINVTKGDYKTSLSGVFSLLKKEEQELKKTKIDSLEVIQRKFDILLSFYELFFQDKAPLIIMVDDLDRILPEKSVEILEILRIFFEKSKKIHFICAIDIRVIEKGIERKFNQLNKGGDLSRIEMDEYLEKIITLPFDLPAIPLVDLGDNIKGLNELIKEKYNIEKKIDQVNIERMILKDFLTNKREDQNLLIFIKEYYINSPGYENTLAYLQKNFDKNIKTIGNKKATSLQFIFNDDRQNVILEINDSLFINKLNNDLLKIKIIDNKYDILYRILSEKPESEFENVIKTGLSGNPRKIKRFLDVFEVYFKILIFRSNDEMINEISNNKNNKKTIDTFKKYAILLSKMLIIKLEWDEIYRKFINDKTFLGIVESISRLLPISGSDQFSISYDLINIVKPQKKYKVQNLLGMLSIKGYFLENNLNLETNTNKAEYKKEIIEFLNNVYIVYYLIGDINLTEKDYKNNENIDNLYKANLIKYLYENDEIKIDNYIKLIIGLTDSESIINETNNVLKFYQSTIIENNSVEKIK